MPFRSKAQQRFLYATNPKVAREFSEDMTRKDFKKLPERSEGAEKRGSAMNEEKRVILETGGIGAGIAGGALLGKRLALRAPKKRTLLEKLRSSSTKSFMPRTPPWSKSGKVATAKRVSRYAKGGAYSGAALAALLVGLGRTKKK